MAAQEPGQARLLLEVESERRTFSPVDVGSGLDEASRKLLERQRQLVGRGKAPGGTLNDQGQDLKR